LKDLENRQYGDVLILEIDNEIESRLLNIKKNKYRSKK
jgi:hypothetical protein